MKANQVTAVRCGSTMVFAFRLNGRDTSAVATLPGGGTDVQTVLVMDGTREAAAKTSAGQVIRVFGVETWNRLLGDVSAVIAPDSPNHGTLVTVADREFVVCRDVRGEPGFLPLTRRPPGVKITHRLAPIDLVRRLATALEARHPRGPAVFVTGTEPPLVVLDPAGPRLTLLNAPPEEITNLPVLGSSPDVTMRGLLSLGLRSGVVHTAKNPATTAVQAAANLVTAADAAARSPLSGLPEDPPPPVKPAPPMDPSGWERYLDHLSGAKAIPATVEFHIGGRRYFPEFIQAVQEARETIDILSYIWDTDDYAIQMADLLRQRSHHVMVRVLVDEAACFQASLMPPSSPQQPNHRPPSSIINYLRRDSRVEVCPMAMSALTANHGKMVIIDGQRAWLGGMNIGREYRVDWHDMMVEVRGPLIGWMQQSFDTTWAHQGWGGDVAAAFSTSRSRLRAQSENAPVPAGAFPVRPMRNSAVHRDLTNSQIEALRRVQHSVWLQNAYITDVRYIRELILARRRGVDVRVILPEDNDMAVLKTSNQALVDLLLRHGIRVYLLPGMSHTKAAIYDGWATLGSANYDRLSLRVNREFNIAFSHPPAVEKLRRELFLKDMSRSREISTPSHPNLSTSRRWREIALRLVAGQL